MNKWKIKIFNSRFSLKDQMYFAKRLSFLIGGKMTVADSIGVIKKQTRSKFQRGIMEKIENDVSAGKYLSTSMSAFSNIFGNYSINIIKIGELSGVLETNLNYLATELQKKQALKQKIINSLIYPTFIIFATVSVSILLVVFIFPKIKPIFSSLNVKLPITTRAIIFLSDMIKNYWIIFLVLLIILPVLFVFLFKRKKRFRFVIEKILIDLPFIGRIIVAYNLANIFRTLGLLLNSGIVLNRALELVADTTNNLIYKREFLNLYEEIERGKRFSGGIQNKEKIFPGLSVSMISVGELTGVLPESFVYLSELYENEVDDLTRNLSGFLEPILMVFIGIVVGIIAISIISPIYELTQNIKVR